MRVQRHLRPDVLKHGGAVPFRNYKEKNKIINELKSEYGKLCYVIEKDLIIYEYKVIC